MNIKKVCSTLQQCVFSETGPQLLHQLWERQATLPSLIVLCRNCLCAAERKKTKECTVTKWNQNVPSKAQHRHSTEFHGDTIKRDHRTGSYWWIPQNAYQKIFFHFCQDWLIIQHKYIGWHRILPCLSCLTRRGEVYICINPCTYKHPVDISSLIDNG